MDTMNGLVDMSEDEKKAWEATAAKDAVHIKIGANGACWVAVLPTTREWEVGGVNFADMKKYYAESLPELMDKLKEKEKEIVAHLFENFKESLE